MTGNLDNALQALSIEIDEKGFIPLDKFASEVISDLWMYSTSRADLMKLSVEDIRLKYEISDDKKKIHVNSIREWMGDVAIRFSHQGLLNTEGGEMLIDEALVSCVKGPRTSLRQAVNLWDDCEVMDKLC